MTWGRASSNMLHVLLMVMPSQDEDREGCVKVFGSNGVYDNILSNTQHPQVIVAQRLLWESKLVRSAMFCL
jgi:hypothetical protein